MKLLVLLSAALLSACASGTSAMAFPPRMIVAYRDLRLDTVDHRAKLVRRVERAAKAFCEAYDLMDPETRFDARLASGRHCPGAAAILLAYACARPTGVSRGASRTRWKPNAGDEQIEVGQPRPGVVQEQKPRRQCPLSAVRGRTSSCPKRHIHLDSGGAAKHWQWEHPDYAGGTDGEGGSRPFFVV
jgi:UrcA family protein